MTYLGLNSVSLEHGELQYRVSPEPTPQERQALEAALGEIAEELRPPEIGKHTSSGQRWRYSGRWWDESAENSAWRKNA